VKMRDDTCHHDWPRVRVIAAEKRECAATTSGRVFVECNIWKQSVPLQVAVRVWQRGT
jgi:hypothetical protein